MIELSLRKCVEVKYQDDTYKVGRSFTSIGDRSIEKCFKRNNQSLNSQVGTLVLKRENWGEIYISRYSKKNAPNKNVYLTK